MIQVNDNICKIYHLSKHYHSGEGTAEVTMGQRPGAEQEISVSGQ